MTHPCLVRFDLLQALYISVCRMDRMLAQLMMHQVLTTIVSLIFVFCQGQACCCSLAH